jgi:hypothetical protein
MVLGPLPETSKDTCDQQKQAPSVRCRQREEGGLLRGVGGPMFHPRASSGEQHRVFPSQASNLPIGEHALKRFGTGQEPVVARFPAETRAPRSGARRLFMTETRPRG